MAPQTMVREENAGVLTVRLEGTFNTQAALQLRQTLDASRSRQLVLDFSRVRTFLDSAVPVLTSGLRDRKVELRGLADHQVRMFRYFGVGVAGSERPYYKPEDVLAV
jgi:hypothetical protein